MNDRQGHAKGWVEEKILAKGGKSYDYVYRDAKGTKVRFKVGTGERFASKEEATEYATERYRFLSNGDAEVTRLDELIEHYNIHVLNSMRPQTAASYRSNLVRIKAGWGAARLGDLDRKLPHLQEWLYAQTFVDSGVAKSLSEKSRQHLKAVFHKLYEHAFAWNFYAGHRNPIKGLKVVDPTKRETRKVNRKVLSPEDWERCESLLEENPRVLMMARIAMLTGMRPSEILGLRWEDFNYQEGSVFLQRSLVAAKEHATKTDSSQADVVLPQILLGWLSEYREMYPVVEGWLFGNANTKMPFHQDVMGKRWLAPRGTALGIPDFGWYTFRHSYTALLGAMQVPMGLISMMMRHTAKTVTEGYGRHENLATKRKIANLVGRHLYPEWYEDWDRQTELAQEGRKRIRWS